jgi:formylglycine-generating enzyme required for sulfatase activity
MVLVPGGTTHLPTNASDNAPSEVSISDFYIGKYEVTQAQWLAVMGVWPGTAPSAPPSGYGLGDKHPAYYVSWNDIVGTSAGGGTVAYTERGVDYYDNGFCYKLSYLVDQGLSKKFRLPTEAEWEYAAKGGQSHDVSKFPYSGSSSYDAVAWCYENSGSKGSGDTDYGSHAGGEKGANELGIHDMSGNVFEWVGDKYNVIYPNDPVDATDNPTGSVGGSNRVWRGGSWNSLESNCSVSVRNFIAPADRLYFVGFRLVLFF